MGGIVMNINKMADSYIGHPREIDEGVEVYSKREAYKKGAEDIIEMLLVCLCKIKTAVHRNISDIDANLTELTDSSLKRDERREKALIKQNILMITTLRDWRYVEEKIDEIKKLLTIQNT